MGAVLSLVFQFMDFPSIHVTVLSSQICLVSYVAKGAKHSHGSWNSSVG